MKNEPNEITHCNRAYVDNVSTRTLLFSFIFVKRDVDEGPMGAFG